MKQFTTSLKLLLVLGLLAGGSAAAKQPNPGTERRYVPEFDAATAGAIAAIVAGGALVIARRRRR